MTTVRLRMKEYIQPFERILALAEVTALTGTRPTPEKGGPNSLNIFVAHASEGAKVLADRLAYWELVETRKASYLTSQVLSESTVNVVRNGIDIADLRKLLPFKNGNIPLPSRRCLRYGPHGIHEYRGKFFPQLVRSLLNVAEIPRNGLVADPMSGSGTTLVEGMLYGCRSLGMDMNPLSLFLTRTKCKLLSAKPSEIARAYIAARSSLLSSEARGTNRLAYFRTLPDNDQNYLRSWFSEETLVALDELSMRIHRTKSDVARDLMLVALSNILRRVSWQKEDDLRIRKEVRLDVDIDPKREFLEEMGRSVRAVLALLYQREKQKLGTFQITEGDARRCDQLWRQHLGKVDTVITSPPYATALPYIDTDRLSLCYLGLLARPKHRQLDAQMIGNREVTNGLRREYFVRFQRDKKLLPESVNDLILRIQRANEGSGVGFRRRNLPALLAKYFFDMRETLAGIHALLRPGSRAFIVVGNNHTVAGGKRVDIRTAELLSEIAASLGFRIHDPIPMEMLVSRDIFRDNAMASEAILSFQKVS